MMANDPAIMPTLSLYKMAIKNKVAVFFITGRQELQRQTTIQNLKSTGYTQYARLYMRKNGDTQEAGKYKSAIRKKLVAQGYDIIGNIGDQYSDLSGGYADAVYKVPNPMYFIP